MFSNALVLLVLLAGVLVMAGAAAATARVSRIDDERNNAINQK